MEVELICFASIAFLTSFFKHKQANHYQCVHDIQRAVNLHLVDNNLAVILEPSKLICPHCLYSYSNIQTFREVLCLTAFKRPFILAMHLIQFPVCSIGCLEASRNVRL